MSTTIASVRLPAKEEYFEYYDKYVRVVPSGDFLELFAAQVDEVRSFFQGVSERDATVLHGPYTWTIKQVVGHLIDTERIFANRLHRFAFGDLQPLPGMEQNLYVANSDYETPALKPLVDELLHCRQANVLLLRRLKPQAWDHRGVASSHSITVRALAYILAGHIIHHLAIVRQRLGTLATHV